LAKEKEILKFNFSSASVLEAKRANPNSIAIIAINASIDSMASITIRKLPESTKRRLRIRAARNGHSMEQEARELLQTALQQPEPPQQNLADAIREIFAPLGGVELQIPKREPIPEDRVRKLFR
jgi:antitoxin FitA